MALLGYTFDRGIVNARNDSSLFSYLNRDYVRVLPNRGNLFQVTTQGLDLVLDTGQAIIMGRHVELNEAVSMPVTANTSGYFVIEIDLSRTNTSSGVAGTSDYTVINNQLTLKTVTSLTQHDLNNGGSIYQMNLGSYSASSSAINFTRNDVIYSPVTITLNDVSGLLTVLNDLTSRIVNLESRL